jgi:hypothetical protein
MKCCGSERTTPFCPTCGKRLANPSPLVGVLEGLVNSHKRAKTELKEAEYRFSSFVNKSKVPDFVKKARDKVEKYERQIDAVQEAMNTLSSPAKVMSDWLKDNVYEEAGKALLGAFTGVPT